MRQDDWTLWLKELWNELTKPPALLDSQPFPNRPNSKPRPNTALAVRPSKQKSRFKPIKKKSIPHPKKATSRSFEKKSEITPAFTVTSSQASLYDAISAAYAITIIAAKEQQDGSLLIETDQERQYVITPTLLSISQLRALDLQLNSLWSKGYRYLSLWLTTTSKQPFFIYKEKKYTARDWVDGERPRFRSTRQIGLCARTLARLYAQTMHDRANAVAITPYSPHQIIHTCEKRIETLYAKWDKTDYSLTTQSLLQTAKEHIAHDFEKAKEIIHREKEHSEMHQEGLMFSTVHPARFRIHPRGYAHIITYEDIHFGIRAIDLALLLHHTMVIHETWTTSLTLPTLIAYQRIAPLSQFDTQIVSALLQLPLGLVDILLPVLAETASRQDARIDTFVQQALLLDEERRRFLPRFIDQLPDYSP